MSDLLSRAQDRSQWPLLHELILSGQVPADRLSVLAETHPDFWAWHLGIPFPPGSATQLGVPSTTNAPQSRAGALLPDDGESA